MVQVADIVRPGDGGDLFVIERLIDADQCFGIKAFSFFGFALFGLFLRAFPGFSAGLASGP